MACADFLWPVLRGLLFQLPAETAHHWTMDAFATLIQVPGLGRLATACFHVRDPRLQVRCFGRDFPNPVGLAAGMDKNAHWHEAFQALGFGFLEVGTITAQPQPGNARPRIFRLRQDRALLNRMGSPNVGAAAVAAHLAAHPPQAILGINIGKTAATPNEKAADDYRASFEHLYPFADYFVLNVSSPNTPGLRALQAGTVLAPILRLLRARDAVLARQRHAPPKPLLVKIAPDLDEQQLHEVVDLCLELNLAGIIVANTTTARTGLQLPAAQVQALGAGGISGRPLTQRSRSLVAAVYRRTAGRLPIIGVGGILTPDDAWQLLRAGASLVQVHTGLVYGGPGFIAAINRYLLRQLDQRGLTSIAQVIGEASAAAEAGASAIGVS